MSSAPSVVFPFAKEQLAPPDRPTRIRVVNAVLDRAWQSGWARCPTLDPDALVAVARRKTSLADLGDGGEWRRRLDILADALHAEATLTPLGRTIAHGQIIAAIANRLRVHALWARYPGILEQPLGSPIVVLGHMRSGTTRMHRLLACDPRFTFTRFFESWNPVPRRLDGATDDRRWRATLALRSARFLNPDFDIIHPTGVTQPDEEIGLHSLSLFGSAFEAQWRVPSFAAHCERIDTRPVYAEFRRLLQTIAWLRRDRTPRPWILKVPQMSQDVDAVLATFPDARIVRVHRHMPTVVASSASLVHNQMVLQSARVDRAWIGREWLRKVALRERRTRHALAAADVPQVEVAFDDMMDWQAQMARVYRALDLPFDHTVQTRMRRYLARSGSARLNRHRYSLTDFGLTAAAVHDAINV